jgi:hypothetical protein
LQGGLRHTAVERLRVVERAIGHAARGPFDELDHVRSDAGAQLNVKLRHGDPAAARFVLLLNPARRHDDCNDAGDQRDKQHDDASIAVHDLVPLPFCS